MLINKSAIMKHFHKNGIQVNILTLNIIDEMFEDVLNDMVDTAKEKSIKRIKPGNLHKFYHCVKDDWLFQIYLKYTMTIQTT